jgi:DNA-binding LacI/PurR family transcriptional regulator
MTTEHARPPLPAERRAGIEAALHRDGIVRISQLAQDLGVAAVTLRRDLAQMERRGLLVRVHGGAVPTGPRTGSDDSAEGPRGVGAQSAQNVEQERTPLTHPKIAALAPSLSYYWPGIVAGMREQAKAEGYDLVVRGASYELQDERPLLQRLVDSQDITGLLVAPNTEAEHASETLAWLEESGLPYVLVERNALHPETHAPMESATTDHALGGYLAASHLASLGHQRVGIVLSQDSPTSQKIAQGWHQACEELGMQPSHTMESMLPDRNSPDFPTAVDQALEDMTAAGITGLLVHPDAEAMAIGDLALNRGISIPEDLSLVAYDDEVASLFTPSLTAVSPPRHQVGRAAVRLLADRLRNPERVVHRVVLSPSMQVRDSTTMPDSGAEASG